MILSNETNHTFEDGERTVEVDASDEVSFHVKHDGEKLGHATMQFDTLDEVMAIVRPWEQGRAFDEFEASLDTCTVYVVTEDGIVHIDMRDGDLDVYSVSLSIAALETVARTANAHRAATNVIAAVMAA